MTKYFVMCNINWWDFSPEQMQKQALEISGGICHQVAGIYDLIIIFDEQDKTNAATKLDRIRKITGIKHTMTLISIKNNEVLVNKT